MSDTTVNQAPAPEAGQPEPTPPAKATKTIFQSRTVAANAFAIGALFIPGVGPAIAAHPEIAMGALAALNLLLRAATHQRLTLFAE